MAGSRASSFLSDLSERSSPDSFATAVQTPGGVAKNEDKTLRIHNNDGAAIHSTIVNNSVVFRYEEPNPMTRWDSPLFTLIWEDDDAQAKSVFASLWEAVAGEGRKAVKPNQATVQRSRDAGGDYLYVLDRETQDIVRRILEGQGEEGGGTVSVPNGGDARARELTVALPGRKLGVPQMQRHRRAFVGLNRGGIGLEGVGEFTVTRMREGFVGYLNDAFDKEDV
ncbi:hypothetical protein BN1723_001422 [Verticillium longisporum]|uniref:Uncharacterized protein n=1 Tax=Verticillium longisporum TaxID=100787 RepID=A0A0G4NNX2_VERLO|nr:hypothetical protein BN1723_001422 [Verticillium longisporum]